MANLAIAGGKPLFPENSSFQVSEWPPRDERTAERLREIYFSGDWSFNSPAEQQFEQEFAAAHDAAYGVFMANGTTTLECALQVLGVKAGDEVIVPALTWMATALAASYFGAIPVFVDIEPDTLCMDPEKLEAAITPKTRAIIPVHAYSSMADLERILAVANRHGIPVIEDCAHMHGGKWAGRGVGTWGAVGSFSFQQSKTMASGEGGICITNDPEIANKIYLMKHIGYARNVKQGQAIKAPEGLLCHNYRATAFQAVILSEQLRTLPERLARYDESARILNEAIADVPGVRLQKHGRLATLRSYYSLHFLFDGPEFADIPKSRLTAATKAEGFEVGNVCHGPVYKHALFNLDASRGQFRIAGGSCPVCEKLTPCDIGLTHQTLYYPETAEKIGTIIRKVALNANELRKLS